MNLDFLTRKLGPLPTWAWIGGGGLALGLAYRYYQSRKAAATAATPVGAGGTTAADTGASASSPDISGLGGAPLTGAGGGTSGGGTIDTGTGTGTGFSTGPIAPPDGFTFDANGNLVPLSQVQGEDILNFISGLASQGYRLDASTGLVEPIVSGTVPGSPTIDLPDTGAGATPAGGGAGAAGDLGSTPAPVLPTAPPVTDIPANTTSPPAHETLASGTQLWIGTATPDLKAIAAAHNLPLSALKVTHSGPNTVIGGVKGSRTVVSVA